MQGGDGSPALLLSSSRREVRLWDVTAMDGGPACGWDDCRGGHFNHAGSVVAAVSSRQSRCSCCFASGCVQAGPKGVRQDTASIMRMPSAAMHTVCCAASSWACSS